MASPGWPETCIPERVAVPTGWVVDLFEAVMPGGRGKRRLCLEGVTELLKGPDAIQARSARVVIIAPNSKHPHGQPAGDTDAGQHAEGGSPDGDGRGSRASAPKRTLRKPHIMAHVRGAFFGSSDTNMAMDAGSGPGPGRAGAGAGGAAGPDSSGHGREQDAGVPRDRGRARHGPPRPRILSQIDGADIMFGSCDQLGRAGPVEQDTDFQGGDLAKTAAGLVAESPAHCASLCSANAACHSWTYVKQAGHTSQRRCFLKASADPARTQSICCDSGRVCRRDGPESHRPGPDITPAVSPSAAPDRSEPGGTKRADGAGRRSRAGFESPMVELFSEETFQGISLKYLVGEHALGTTDSAGSFKVESVLLHPPRNRPVPQGSERRAPATRVTLCFSVGCADDSHRVVLHSSVEQIRRVRELLDYVNTPAVVSLRVEVLEDDGAASMPPGVWLYEHAQLGGDREFLAAAPAPGIAVYRGRALRLRGSASSVSVPAGVTLKLCSSDISAISDPARVADAAADCRMTQQSIEWLTPLGLNDRIQLAYVTFEPLESLSGMVAFADANFRGESQFYGPGQYRRLGPFADRISSLWLTKDCEAKIFLRIGCRGAHAALKRGARVEDFSDPVHSGEINDNIKSIEITARPVCKPPCEHGECVPDDAPHEAGPGQAPTGRCKCSDGYAGLACSYGIAGVSSSVFCDRNAVMLGERLRCTISSRFGMGAAVKTCAGSFSVATGPAQAKVVLPRGWHSDSGALPNCAAPSLEHTFTVAPLSPSPTRSFEPLFNITVEVGAKLGEPPLASRLTVPRFWVGQPPDGSSSLECAKADVVVGEQTRCRVALRARGEMAATLQRTLSINIEGLSSGAFRLGALRAVTGDDPAGEYTFSVTLLTQEQDRVRVTAQLRLEGEATPAVKLGEAQIRLRRPRSDDPLGAAKASLWQQQFREAEHALSNVIRSDHLEADARQARWLRANVYLLCGQFHKARADLAAFRTRQQQSCTDDVAALQGQIQQASELKDRALVSHALGQLPQALDHLTGALQLAKASVFLRLLRAETALGLENYGVVRHDTGVVLNQDADNQRAMLVLAEAQFELLGHIPAALSNLRRCGRVLSSDQYSANSADAARCAALQQRIEAVCLRRDSAKRAQDEGRWSDALHQLEEQLSIDKSSMLRKAARSRVCVIFPRAKLSPALEDFERAIRSCTMAIDALDEKEDLYAQDAHELFGTRAWARAGLEQVREALQDITRALAIATEHGSSAVPRLESLQDAIRAAVAPEDHRPKDYYKILGVPATATAKEIRAAYRKLVRIWHPDKVKLGPEDDPAEAKHKFMDIVEAHEVLTEQALRDRFDRGEDVGAEAGRAEEWDAQFHYNKDDVRPDGTVNAWYIDPETGEKDFVDLKVYATASDDSGDANDARPPQPRHCCLG